ncbi:MAG: TolC family protein [Pirellulaceae bacterium]|nr:TolC family protein [Pirellulaceae bacterium]
MRELFIAIGLLSLMINRVLSQVPTESFDFMSVSTSASSRSSEIEPEIIGWVLADLKVMALDNNPTLRQARAQVEAARGAALQAGLRPNPFVGTVAEQIGVNGTAGELQGGFVSQEFVRGNKLGLSREKYLQRGRIAETNWTAQKQRVLNDVSVKFYQALAAQLMVKIQQQAFEVSEDNLLTLKEMMNMGQVGEAEVLQAEVERRRELLKRTQASNDVDLAWRELISFVGIPDTQTSTLLGTLAPAEAPLDWDTAVAQLLASSPQIAAAQQKIRYDQIVVRREQVESIPNVTLDLTTGYNSETQQATGGFRAGLPLPVYNRNQGTVRQARADLSSTCAELERLKLELRNGLAKQYRDYISAWQNAQEYEQNILPRSRKAVALLTQSYNDRRSTWTTVLDAKRTLLGLEAEQINNSLSYQLADIAIRGNLLVGGLTEPIAPISGGHIDANNQPR